MLECTNNRLVFSFPEVHPEARVEVEFQRTLRIPDNDSTHGLPPGLGAFPVRNVDDYKSRLSAETIERGGVMIPMYQAEALWISFRSHNVPRQGSYPFALKIGAGKRSAITANKWTNDLIEDDYVIVPVQPWLDGFMLEAGTIRQFIAAPLGAGYTVEEQLTGKAEFGGIQIEAFPMTAEEFNRRFPVQPDRIRRRSMMGGSDGFKGGGGFLGGGGGGDDDGYHLESFNMAAPAGAMRAVAMAPKSMGMAAGGRMKQEIIKDPYGLDVWSTDHSSRAFVHLFNSQQWTQITGETPPTTPATMDAYRRYNYPWYPSYVDTLPSLPHTGTGLGSTTNSNKIKSAAEIDATTDGVKLVPDNSGRPKARKIRKNEIKDGEW